MRKHEKHNHRRVQIHNGGVILNSVFVKRISFTLSFQSNNLIADTSRYSKEQEDLFQLVDYLHHEGLSYPKIADYLNERKYLTYSGKPYRKSNISSLILRNKQRKERIKLRNKVYPTKIRKFIVKLSSN